MRVGRQIRTIAVVAAVAILTIGVAWAQERAPEPDPKGAGAGRDRPKDNGTAKTRKKGGVRAPVAPPKKAVGRGDPLAKAAPSEGAPQWPFHYKLKIAGADGQPLAVSFYPSRAGATASVIMLIHDRGTGHSGKDFEEPIEGLKGEGLAEHLQDQDYAVLVLDLRGHGANPRHENDLPVRVWHAMVGDLQAAYLFLVDRHNRRELNLAKLGVIAIGDGSNLAAAWAASAGGAVSSDGRISDLAGLVLVSPVNDSGGLLLAPAVSVLAPRIPLMIVGGDRDAATVNALKDVVERQRLSKISLLKTRLQGSRLLRFEPKAATTITKFLEEPVKFRNNAEWEPRYLLTPIAYSHIELVAKNLEGDDAAANPPRTKAKAAPAPPPDEPKDKAAPEKKKEEKGR
jgi:alpha-beta hydrolase superfamily lysophospholipase